MVDSQLGNSQRDAAQGRADDRPAANRVPGAGRRAHAADGAARRRRSHRDARIDRVSRHHQQVHAHAARRVRVSLFLLEPRAGEEGDQSSTAVRAKIRKLVSAEDPEKPLSDSQIAQMLSEGGVTVARRTVAKYREAMKIPSSSDRKRSKSQ